MCNYCNIRHGRHGGNLLKIVFVVMDKRNKMNGHVAEKDKVLNDKKLKKVKRGKWSAYIIALRPWSFSASMTPVALGCALCYKMTNHFDLVVFILTCITALAVHAAGNLVNTYYDYIKGVDSKVSDDRTLVDHLLTSDEVVRLGALSYLVGCLGLTGLVFLCSASVEQLALLFFGGLSSSFLYTGGFALKYYALGDLVIVITFGPLAVLFSYVAQCGSLSMLPLIYAVPLALNTEAILHSNNTRDMKTDEANGIITLAILLGQKGSYILYVFLLFTPYIIFSVMAVNYNLAFLLPLFTSQVAFDLEKCFREKKMELIPQQTAKLNLYLGLLYVLSCLLAV